MPFYMLTQFSWTSKYLCHTWDYSMSDVIIYDMYFLNDLFYIHCQFLRLNMYCFYNQKNAIKI